MWSNFVAAAPGTWGDYATSLRDDQIKWVDTRRTDGSVISIPAQKYYDPLRGSEHYLFTYYDEKNKKLIRVQDLMIENIILTNQWKYPIVFSSTVPPDGRINLDNHLKKAGFALKLVPEEGKCTIAEEQA